VGLALRANPQAPFERTSRFYHQNIATGEKTEPAWKMLSPPNLLEVQSPPSDEAERDFLMDAITDEMKAYFEKKYPGGAL
jgi:hypothetical protein